MTQNGVNSDLAGDFWPWFRGMDRNYQKHGFEGLKLRTVIPL
jgi:hypothetical protein